MLALIAAVAVITSPILPHPFDPTIDVSAVRQIVCDKWTGSGFLIGDRIMATANHVMEGGTGCHDARSGAALHVYKTDKPHDLVLVTGNLPTNLPYIKYSCAGYKTGEMYLNLGISGYGQASEITHLNVVKAEEDYTGDSFKVAGSGNWPGMRHLTGRGVPGLSGGLYANLDGYAVGMVNVGGMIFGMPGRDHYSYEFKNSILCKF